MNRTSAQCVGTGRAHRARRQLALLSIAVMLSAFASKADELNSVDEPIAFLVIEGELLTGPSEPDADHAIDLLRQASTDTGLSTDFVIEHAALAPPADAPPTGRANQSLTIWNRFDTSRIEIVESQDGQSLAVTLQTEAGLALDLEIESDVGPIAVGTFADEETWFRLNVFERAEGGALAIDLEYALVAEGAIQSGRLRLDLATVKPSENEEDTFVPITESELFDARPGGIARYWLRFGEGAAAAPRYFSEQFSETPVVSREEALRLVAPDRLKVEARQSQNARPNDPSRSSPAARRGKANGPKPKPKRRNAPKKERPAPEKPASRTGAPSAAAGLDARSAFDGQENPEIDDSEAIAAPESSSSDTDARLEQDRLDTVLRRTPRPTENQIAAGEEPEAKAEDQISVRGLARGPAETAELKSIVQSPPSPLWPAAGPQGMQPPNLHASLGGAQASTGATVASAAPNTTGWLSETIEQALDRLRGLVERGLEWWEEVGS